MERRARGETLRIRGPGHRRCCLHVGLLIMEKELQVGNGI